MYIFIVSVINCVFSLNIYNMTTMLKCVVCQKRGGRMAVMTERGLNTFKDCSVIRKDNFISRITTTGPSMIELN